MSEPIRVVVADDSPFIRGLIVSYLEADGFEVVGTAEDGKQAVERVRELQPDVVSLDVDMPVMSGLEALDEIMRDVPTPAVMVSGVSSRSADTTLRAIQAGAVDFILKYVPGAKVNPEEIRLDVISKMRAAASVRVVRTITSRLRSASSKSSLAREQAAREAEQIERSACHDRVVAVPNDLIVVGASTGGPIAIKQLLQSLPSDFAAPIVIVQHIPQLFTEVLAAQLNSQTAFNANVVHGGEKLLPRNVYIAPGDRHLLLSGAISLELHDGPPICGHRPSIDVAMKSIAQYFPNRIHGVLLTGMGADGASGLAYVQSRGGTTYAQDAQSCVVFGMPKRAIEMGAVDHVASPDGIAEQLARQLAKNGGSVSLGKENEFQRTVSVAGARTPFG